MTDGPRAVPRLQGLLLAALVAALLVFPPLGRQVLNTSDEARFALLARDMLERGTWFDAEIRGERYRNKPPLYPWAIVLLSLPGGRVTETTAHAPVALAAVAAVVCLFLLGDRLFGPRVSLSAALILTTSYGFYGHSQILLPDMIVLAFGTVAGYAFWRAVAEPPGQGPLVTFYAALAFGAFAKGPFGLLPLLPAAAWLWTERGPRGLVRLFSPWGIGVFALVTASWVGPFLALGSRSFAEKVLVQNWVQHYVGFPVPQRLGNLAEDLLLGFLPWTVLAPLALAYARRTWKDSRVRFAVLWFAVPLLVVALAHNQRTRYLLPVYPGLALLVASWAHAEGAARSLGRRLLGGAVVAGTAGGIAVMAARALNGLPAGDVLPALGWQALPLVAGIVLVGMGLGFGLWSARPRLVVYGTVVGMVFVLGWGIWLYDRWVNETQDFRRLAESVQRHADGGAVRVFGGRFFSADFYLGRSLRRLRTVEEFNEYLLGPERPVVVVNGRTWRLIQGQVPAGVQELERQWVRGQEMLIVRASPPMSDGTTPRR